MFWAIVVVLFLLWLVGVFAFHVASGLIHILLVLAVVAIVVRVARRT